MSGPRACGSLRPELGHLETTSAALHCPATREAEEDQTVVTNYRQINNLQSDDSWTRLVLVLIARYSLLDPHLTFSKLIGDQSHVDRPRTPVGDGRRDSGQQFGVRGQREAQGDRRDGQREVHLHRVRGDPGEALSSPAGVNIS